MSKKDSVAMIPKYRFPEFLNCLNWKKEELNKLGKVIPGLTYSPQDIREKGLLVLRSSNIKDNIIDLKDTVYVRSDVKGYTLTEEKDILICVRNGSKSLIGKNALVPKGMPLCTNGAFMIVFRANNPCFVFQLFQSEQFNKQVKADLGATINSINSKQLKKYIFTIPQERKEQQKIADCLSSIDDLISAEEKKLSLLNDYKKGWIQKLFPAEGKTVPEWRFPKFRDSGEWQKTKLAKICLITTGKLDANAMVEDGKYRFYTCAKEFFRIDRYTFDTEALLISGNGANVGYIHYYKGKFNAYQRTYVLYEFQENICYVKYFLEKYLSSRIVDEKNIGNTPYIVRGTLSEMEIIIPEKSVEQEKIANFLSGIDELISSQKEKIEKLKQHKKALMQGLFPIVEEVL